MDNFLGLYVFRFTERLASGWWGPPNIFRTCGERILYYYLHETGSLSLSLPLPSLHEAWDFSRSLMCILNEKKI